MAENWEEIVERLQRENAELRAERDALRLRVKELEELVSKLQSRLEELERAAHRPAAPFRRPENKKVPPEQRKRPGREQGHPGAFRQAPQHIDEEIEVPLSTCPHCQGAVTDRVPLTQIIEEIPPCRPRVFRVITWSGTCEKCGTVRTHHPLQTSTAQGAAGTHLGPRALSLATLLNKHLGLTMGKTCQVLDKLCGLKFSRGGLSQALDRVARRVEGDYEQLLKELRGCPAVFADETSWWVGGPQWWLWTFTTPQATVYRVEPQRGSEIVFDTLGAHYGGMLVSDCLATYDKPAFRKHKCIAHHAKAIAAARDRPDTGDTEYLRAWRVFFLKVLIHWASRDKLEPAAYAQGCAHLKAERDQLLAREVNKPGEVAVRNRLAKQREHLLGCLEEPAAEPTNNRAERALRPAVIARKLSCGNKTPRGKHTWEILASLAQTCHLRLDDFVAWLIPRLQLMPAG